MRHNILLQTINPSTQVRDTFEGEKNANSIVLLHKVSKKGSEGENYGCF